MSQSGTSRGQRVDGDGALYPVAGRVITVVTGELLVFVEQPSGRRVPLMSRRAGDVIVGCSPTNTGAQLVATGQLDATYEESAIEDVLAHRSQALENWVHALSEATRSGSWATKVVAPVDDEPLRLAPGEAVVPKLAGPPATDRSILGWLRVASGEAWLCGSRVARIAEGSAPVPLTRGAWLTSGLRTEIARADEPAGAKEWAEALDLVGRLGAQSVSQADDTTRELVVARLAVAEEKSIRQSREGVDLLIGAAMKSPIPSTATDQRSAALTAALLTIEKSGHPVDEAARERAHEWASAGREPIAAAAAATGVRAREVGLPPEWWTREGPPLVALTHDEQYICLSWRGRSWSVADPRELDSQANTIDESLSNTVGRAWEFVPVLASTPSSLRDLGRLAMRRSGRDITVVCLLSAGLALLAFFTPFILGALAGAVDHAGTREVVTGLVVLTLLLVVSVGWRYVRSVALVRLRARSSTLAGGAVWDRMMRLPTTWHGTQSVGDRMMQSSAVAKASAMVPNYIIVDVLDAVTVLGGLAAVATTSGALLAAVTLMLLVQLGVNVWLTKETARRTAIRVNASASSQGRLLETLRGVEQLMVYGAQSRAFKRWALPQAVLTRTDLAVRRIAMVQGLAISAWPVLGLIVLVTVSQFSGASFGEFVTAQTALAISGTALGATALSMSAVMSGRAVLGKLAPVLDAVPEGGAEAVDPGVVSGDVAFHDVTFRYSASEKPVLEDVSFTIGAGEQVAIVGPSGCGKTTLVRVLLGLEEPESGRVTIDGRDMGILDRSAVRRQVGCILQSSSLMPGSIRYNVDMGRGLTTAEVWQALDWAAVGDEVRAMGMGLDTPVVDGGGVVSGGQRQRILLARGLAGSPRILILDEATSAQDNITQASINEYLQSLRLTRIVIAHRLSTIHGVDRILVMSEGRVVQQGTYRELVDAPGHFADLVRRQTL